MCLIVDLEKTEALKREYKDKKQKRITVFKVLDGNVTCHQKYPVSVGWLKPLHELNYNFSNCDCIYEGVIHTYLNEEQCEEWNCQLINYKVIKCYGWAEDLVAVGRYNDACFKKIYIPSL